jgi:hypothetical protein
MHDIRGCSSKVFMRVTLRGAENLDHGLRPLRVHPSPKSHLHCLIPSPSMYNARTVLYCTVSDDMLLVT